MLKRSWKASRYLPRLLPKAGLAMVAMSFVSLVLFGRQLELHVHIDTECPCQPPQVIIGDPWRQNTTTPVYSVAPDVTTILPMTTRETVFDIQLDSKHRHAMHHQPSLLFALPQFSQDVGMFGRLEQTNIESKPGSNRRKWERRVWPRHPTDPHCEPMRPWQSLMFPVCNHIHSTDLRRSFIDQSFELISRKGYWRHAWTHFEGSNPKVVWKTFKLEHDVDEAYFENNRVDALAMERLTASPHIMTAYAYCGLTLVTTFAGKELSQVLAESTPGTAPVSLIGSDKTFLLDLAIKVVQGVADIHSIDGPGSPPSLVHNDINLANLVFTADNRPLLNDFNIAVLLMRHNETGKACPFVSRFPNPQWRAPEEQLINSGVIGLTENETSREPLVTEKVDIYALGNIFYRLIAGSSPWKVAGAKKMMHEEKMQVARLKRYNGTLPAVPDGVKTSSDPIVNVLYNAMLKCYEYDAAQRPSARELLNFLEGARQRLPMNSEFPVAR